MGTIASTVRELTDTGQLHQNSSTVRELTDTGHLSRLPLVRMATLASHQSTGGTMKKLLMLLVLAGLGFVVAQKVRGSEL